MKLSKLSVVSMSLLSAILVGQANAKKNPHLNQYIRNAVATLHSIKYNATYTYTFVPNQPIMGHELGAFDYQFFLKSTTDPHVKNPQYALCAGINASYGLPRNLIGFGSSQRCHDGESAYINKSWVHIPYANRGGAYTYNVDYGSIKVNYYS